MVMEVTIGILYIVCLFGCEDLLINKYMKQDQLNRNQLKRLLKGRELI